MHREKEKGVRCDPSVVASEVREEKMPVLYCVCWNAGADQVPCLAGLRKTPRVDLARASSWADAGRKGGRWGRASQGTFLT